MQSVRAFSGPFLALILLALGMTSLFGNERDSLNALPQVAPAELESIAVLTADGRHPSDFQFAIENATPNQVQAWVNGDFSALQGQYLMDSLRNSKGDMFANVQSAIATAKGAIAEVRKVGNFISQFDGQSLIKLPVALSRSLSDGTQFTAVIQRITLYPTHAELTVFAEVKTGDMKSPIYLGAPDIKFTRRGGISLGSLGLLGDMEIPIMDEKGYLLFEGAKIQNNEFVSGQGTFASFDCDGLQEFNLDLDLAFSRDVIVPAFQADTSSTTRVIAELNLSVGGDDPAAGLNDILVSASISTPFAHPEHLDVIWYVDEMVFDFSATRHDQAVAFPIAGHTPDLPEDMLDNWKGVYISQFMVRLPDGLFSGGDGETTPQFIDAHDLVIDRSGFSGYVELSPVLSLADGNADGWGYSIDWTQVHFYRNSLVGLEFRGLVDVPLLRGGEEEGEGGEGGPGSPQDSTLHLRYEAVFNSLEQTYGFTIADTEERTYDSEMLQAEITLSPASQLSINYSEQNGFEILAELHGHISIDAPIGNPETSNKRLAVSEFNFQDFIIGNREPYVHHPGTWQVGEISVGFGGFDLTVSDIGVVSRPEQPNNVDMQFLGLLNLGANNAEISAEGGFRLQGEIVHREDGKQDWKFQRIKMDALFVDYESPTGAYAFDGHIIFFEDIPVFGSGFQGKLKLEVSKLSDTRIEAMALFGSVDDYRYFFVDVMARLGPGINVGGLDLRGIGGGVYVNMRQQEVSEDFSGAQVGDIIPDYEDIPPVFDPYCDCSPVVDPVCVRLSDDEFVTYQNYCQAECAGYANSIVSCDTIPPTDYEAAMLERLGESLSGIQYQPDSTVRLGVNFGVVLATPTDDTKFNANLQLNFEFSQGGGLNHIRLAGFANVMAPISWTGPACEGVSMQFEMEYEHGTTTETGNGRFLARALVFVNTPRIQGGNVITQDMAGISDGLPDFYNNENGCQQFFYAGGLEMLFSKDDWYVWIGVPNNNPEDIYNLPPFPHYPISLFFSALGQSGIEISGYFDIGTRLPPFPGLPAHVQELTEVGNFDIAPEDRATGRGFALGARLLLDANVNLIGIVQAGFTLDVGFDLMMQKYQSVTCINTGEELGMNGWYAAGQAWAYIQGYVSVLGFNVIDGAFAAAIQVKGPNPTYGHGAVAGRYRVLGGLASGEFRAPFEFGSECETEAGSEPALDRKIIAGALPIDMAQGVFVQQLPIVDFNYPVGEVVSLEDGEGTTNYVVVLEEFEVKLDGETAIDGEVVLADNGYTATFYPTEMMAGNTNYVIFATAALYPCDQNGNPTGGPIDTDVKTNSFITGEDINFIPYANVESAWPTDGQFNFYQNEVPQGFIQLQSGQDGLLGSSGGYEFILKLSDGNFANDIEVDISYNAAENRIEFDLPPLPHNTSYRATLLRQPLNEQEVPPGGNVPRNFELPVTLLTYYFRVSAYDTFADKFAAISFSSMSGQLGQHASQMNNLLEPFGPEELLGNDWLGDPIFSTEADLANTSWMNQFYSISVPDEGSYNLYGSISDIDATVADFNYPLSFWDNSIRRATINQIPTNGIIVEQENTNNYLVTAENYADWNNDLSQFQGWVQSNPATIRYYVAEIIRSDYYAMQNEAHSFEVVRDVDFELQHLCMNFCGNSGAVAPCTTNPYFCCTAFSEYRWRYYDNMEMVYDQHPAYRKFYRFRGGENQECYGSIFPRRELDTNLTTSSNYPVLLHFDVPGQSGASTYTTNLQYSGL